MILRLTVFWICFLIVPASAQPLRVIYDTDMGNDIDDALALAMLHAYADEGQIDLLAVTVTKDNRWAAPYIDLVNTFYGRPDLPIGVVKNGVEPHDSDMIQVPAERTRDDGSLVYPHDLTDGSTAPNAVDLLRRLLAAEADTTVTLIQVGFSTNLARLLDSSPDDVSPLDGQALVAQKVRLLSVMAGTFDGSDHREYNIVRDIPAAQTLFAEWPTPIIVSGFRVGESILYPATSIEEDFDYVEHHPIADAYRQYMEFPYDRQTWDLTSVLVAVEPDAEYFGLSEPGRVRVEEDGETIFEPDPAGQHRYLTVTDEQRRRVLARLIELASRSPIGMRE